MKKPRRIRIRGGWWRVVFKRPPLKESLDGLCDYDTRTIYVNPKALEQRATLIHEVLHACHKDLDEDSVAETEEAIETALRLLE